MSGQPYRYYTDPTKYRTMFMETLDLQANINAMNLEANKTYKETGQLPAVSQMKDTRTTSEILADFEKLKIDIASTIAKISSSPFGFLVVQTILSSPLNTDNKLLVFTAQRIDDIVDKLKKIYKYGIKGDNNDAEQFVNFIETMYNDKNSLVASTKSFMDRYGMRSLNTTGPFIKMYENLVKIGATVRNYKDDIDSYPTDTGIDERIRKNIDKLIDKTEYKSLVKKIEKQSNIIIDYIATLIELVPTDPNRITALEKKVIEESQKIERGTYEKATSFEQEVSDEMKEPTARQKKERIKSILNIPKEEVLKPQKKKYFGKEFEAEAEVLEYYLDFLNRGLPNDVLLISLVSQLTKMYENYDDALTSFYGSASNIFEERNIGNAVGYFPTKNITELPSYSTVINTLQNYLQILQNIDNTLQPVEFWTIPKLKLLGERIKQLEAKKPIVTPPQVNVPVRVEVVNQQPLQIENNAPLIEEFEEEPDSEAIPPLPNKKYSDELNETADELNEFYSKSDTDLFDTDRIDEIFRQLDSEFGKNFSLPEGSDTNDYLINIESAINFLNEEAREARAREARTRGEGLKSKVPKRRGRPKGCGIGKIKTYKEIVKANSATNKGIFETPRFVKFGKYLVNIHRLNNEDIFALKRPSGGNIVEIPSQKLSKNLSSVIKKMLGGEIPTYSDISKLSEPEKAYLHKISKKSNILDKFDIPAPSKDAFEKDIHQFEVMKGEILAGNDNKELIRKFKAHILKLSKSGALPKREVHEILEDLLELNC